MPAAPPAPGCPPGRRSRGPCAGGPSGRPKREVTGPSTGRTASGRGRLRAARPAPRRRAAARRERDDGTLERRRARSRARAGDAGGRSGGRSPDRARSTGCAACAQRGARPRCAGEQQDGRDDEQAGQPGPAARVPGRGAARGGRRAGRVGASGAGATQRACLVGPVGAPTGTGGARAVVAVSGPHGSDLIKEVTACRRRTARC